LYDFFLPSPRLYSAGTDARGVLVVLLPSEREEKKNCNKRKGDWRPAKHDWFRKTRQRGENGGLHFASEGDGGRENPDRRTGKGGREETPLVTV